MSELCGLGKTDVHNLENKLATIERIASDRNKWEKE